MKKILSSKYLWIGLAIVLVIMQFFPIDKTNPPSDPEKDVFAMIDTPDEVAYILKDACFDCHSNHTKYPWYTSVAPLSWWIKGHIDHGREKLNYSVWGDYSENRRSHKMEEGIEFVKNGSMPISSYKIAHPEARITDEQRAILINWFEQNL